MNAAVQDMIETVRQLQKLSRELQPVKAALATLAKREGVTPNPTAAAGSLDKIASRVFDVSQKYSPFLDRASFLLGSELPRLQAATPVMEMCRKLEKTSSKDCGGKGESDAQDPLRLVCSPSVPHILNRVSYHIVCEALRLHVEMVEYLIATGRNQMARHVADAYGLPLYWFPKLAAAALPPLSPIQSGSAGSEERSGRDSTSLLTSTTVSPFAGPMRTKATLGLSEVPPLLGEVSPEHIAIQCIEHRHSVVEAIEYCERRLLPAVESIDPERRPSGAEVFYYMLLLLHVTRILQMFQENSENRESIHAYLAKNILGWATRQPYLVQAVINVLTLCNAEANREETGNKEGSSTANGNVTRESGRQGATRTAPEKEEATRFLACMTSPEGYHKLAVLFHQGAVLAGSQIISLADALDQCRSHAASQSPPFVGGGREEIPEDYGHEVPELVIRAIAASILLKDEYFDRMAINRHNVDWANNDATSDGKLVPISQDHLNTQSGSAVFDEAIMAIVEDMLVTSAFDQESVIALRDERGERPGATNHNGRWLSVTELLQAEERWSSDILFISRPTRFYCYLTKKCFDGGREENYPIALPNGTVVSKLALTHYCSRKASVNGDPLIVVVCPRTGQEFSTSSVKRIFVI
ncbi:unnamed protein product [Trypanosoma congolense IL3000]|uniref:WGS project CAEQ00000000 data, annotated contig 2135 n=1 Tax=Trypanosoma congolense (strain IL3000) TaxID=1068625 RepID=F9WBQ8_TRYCI|nr:unnamed protein product [Trypanosoma congolense IL3000]